MNQQNAESKIEQAAVNNNPPDELHGKAVDLVFKIAEQWGNAAGPTTSAFAIEIINLSKEYWQSLTIPASNDWKAKFHEWLSGRLDIPIPEMNLIISYIERYIASKPRTVEETE